MNQAQWMEEALALAEEAAAGGEIPVGAVVVDRDGLIIGRGRNRRESGDPLGHAELFAIAEAARNIGDWRLEGTTMVVTLEPCAMCAGAISLARVARLIYAAPDPKGGAVEHGPKFFEQKTCHHRTKFARAGDAEPSSKLLKEFFRERR